MFRALLCSTSGGPSCVIQHLVLSRSVGGRPVRRLVVDSSPLSTGIEPRYVDLLSEVHFCVVLCGVAAIR